VTTPTDVTEPTAPGVDEHPADTTKPVRGQPESEQAEPCDEYCEPQCVHHVPSVGWDFSFGSRINFHPRDTTDSSLVMMLSLSDDAVASGMVYRKVEPEQVRTFARALLVLTGDPGPRDLLVEFAQWLNTNGQLTEVPPTVTNDLDDLAGHFLADRRERRATEAGA
jgi:hypothetical protein